MENMRNIIRLKDVPSNTIEEAIIILKENTKAKKFEFSNKFKQNKTENNNDEKYVVKEAELIISDYLKGTEDESLILKKKNKKLKIATVALGFLLFISIIF
jgi:hypothetical protein